MKKCGWRLKIQLLLEKYYSPPYIREHCIPQSAISVPDISYSLTLCHMMLLPKPWMFKYLTKTSFKKIPTLQWRNQPHVLLTGWKWTVHRHFDSHQKSWCKKPGFRKKKIKTSLQRLMINIKELAALRIIKQFRWYSPAKLFPFHQCTI